MRYIESSKLLKNALWMDAAAGGAMALLQLLGTAAVVRLTGLPTALLLGSGAFLLGFVVLLVLMARATRLPAALVLLVVVGNFGWAVGSLLWLLVGSSTGNGFGVAYVLVQALAVLALAEVEYMGLKRSRPAGSGGRLQTSAS
ncbi:MAG: hypothetical protein AB7L76_18240 [Burkholderiaceae bacterium]